MSDELVNFINYLVIAVFVFNLMMNAVMKYTNIYFSSLVEEIMII